MWHAVGFELGDPEFFARPRIERPEAVIVSGANEDQPPAVAMDPPRLEVPVLGIPLASNSSTTPSGTFHAILPVFKSMAFRSPQGGCWQG